MKKRLFRKDPQQKPRADYPTADEFESNRRDFLTRFGATILTAGSLAAVACGDGRAVPAKPDAGGKKKPTPKWDHGVGPAGAAPMPAAGADMPMLGDAPAPDAAEDKKDADPAPGFAPAPDAKIDKKDMGLSGGAPAPDAMADEKK